MVKLRRPLLLAIIIFICGLGIGQLIEPVIRPALFVCLTLLFAAGLAWYFRWRWGILAFLAAVLFLGLLWVQTHQIGSRSELINHLNTHLSITGTVIQSPKFFADRAVYVIKVQEIRQGERRWQIDEKVELVLSNSRLDRLKGSGSFFPRYRYGDVLEVDSQLVLPSTRRNPGEFDYREFLARRGIYTRALVFEPDQVRLTGYQPSNPLVKVALAAKSKAAGIIENHLSPQMGGIMLAVLFGDQEWLDDRQVEIFRNLGLFHVFSVSGLHVGFLLLFLFEITRIFKMPKQRLVFLGLPVLLFYAAVTDFTPPVVRASLMASMGLFAYFWDRDRDFYTALGVAAFIILLFNPQTLFESGFQLSFIATWGLVYLYPLLDDLLSFLPAWRKFLIVPMAAQLALLPVTAYYFNILSPGALIANPLIVPLVGLLVILGLLMFLFSLFLPPIAIMLALSGGAMTGFVVFVVELISYMPGAVYSVRTPSLLEMILFYAALIMFREYRMVKAQTRDRAPLRPQGILLAALILTVCLLGATPFLRGHLQKDLLQVVFLDVGQGSSIFIRTPAGKTALVDGGGQDEKFSRFDPGARIVVPYLIRQGVRQVDLVVNTHPHTDHLAGLFAVMDKKPVALTVTPPPDFFVNEYQEFSAFLAERQIRAVTAKKGDQIWLDPRIEIQVLAPDKPLFATRCDLNNNSLVLKLSYGSTSILLTGDIEMEAMELLYRDYGGYLDCDIFMVPHHGSKYGLHEGFLAAIRPEAAVIQVGERNTFDHPAAEIIRYWQGRKVPVYRNDMHGAITFWSDGRNWWVETEIGPSKEKGLWRQVLGW